MKRLTLVAALIAAALAGPVNAQAQAQADDILDKVINIPAPAAHRVDGSKGSLRNDEGVQGGKALRIAVPGKSERTWAVAVGSAIGKPVSAGDSLVLAFWARLAKGEGGATTASLPCNAVQLSSPPYTALFNQPVSIGPEWKIYEVKGKADKDHAAGTLDVAIHLATAKQIVELGPIFVLNLGR